MLEQIQTKSATDTAIAWFDRYRDRDVDAMIAMFVPDAIIDYVPLNLTATPAQLAENGWRVLIDAFPDLTNEVKQIWQDPSANTVFVDVYIGGTQRQDAFGIPNQGQKYWLRHLFVLQINDRGKIAKMTTFWDSASWYQQLGKTQLP
ncbi:MAG: ester cyclase [Cyanosarcina radialis HA8281-LM2]|jgi:steroid delta-isomerase-like uncharacterized protein|nr:ester cyclase [Cyanosarcina radialis HA8281-LM2]